MLGVPRVLDRLVQQAIAQVFVPIFGPEFSGSSFGFCPGRSAHQAVRVAGSPVLARALPNARWDGLDLRMLKPTWQRLRSAG